MQEQTEWVFHSIIDGYDSWGELFQSIDAFRGLIEVIYQKHNLKMNEIEQLTPGTNAVFRIQDKVIKIFAPIESGFSTNDDYYTELASMEHAAAVGVTAPGIVCYGSIEDRYEFRYILMDYIHGEDIEHYLLHCRDEEKKEIGLKLKSITVRLNIKSDRTNVPEFDLTSCTQNERWNILPLTFRKDREDYLRKHTFSELVYTHGDLTGENIIVTKEGDLCVIDLADSHLAPFYYEWPPIVFALFACDPLLMKAYFGAYENELFYQQLTLSLVIHDFGAGLIRQICEVLNIVINDIVDMDCLKRLITECIHRGDVKVR